jgi:hypothetical protein
MSTLREAAQQALETLEKSRVFVTAREKIKHPEGTEWYDGTITELRAALEQPEQEPFGYIWPTGRHPEFRYTQQMRDGVAGMPLYTHPPRREWQSLTEEEIKAAVGASAEFWATSALWIKSVARAIERACKERNT